MTQVNGGMTGGFGPHETPVVPIMDPVEPEVVDDEVFEAKEPGFRVSWQANLIYAALSYRNTVERRDFALESGGRRWEITKWNDRIRVKADALHIAALAPSTEE